MKTKLLSAAMLLVLSCSNMLAQTKTATLVLTSSTKYQYIDGFGGTGMNGQWADVYTQAKVNKLWGTGANQIGLNIMRIRINPNENSWGEYGNPVKWARAVHPGVQVFATPWTPPKKYKTSKDVIYKNDFGTDVYPIVEHSWGGQGSNGGAINPAYYDEYADFLERYRQAMEKKGCPIDMISIQNESDYTPTGGGTTATYESCIYSPTEMAAMVKAARAAVDPSCKIMGPECFGWDQHKYNNKLVTLQDAVNNIDVWGNHLYGTNDWSFVQSVTSKTGKHMWMTEFLIDYDDNYNGSFTAEYPMIESIEKAMASGYNAYIYYNMLNDFFAVNHGGSETELWKRAYVFSHYAKHATGKTRIRSTLNDTNKKLIGGSSYRSADGDTVTIFLCNTSATDTYKVTVGLPFVPEIINQVVTGESVNARLTDETATYSNGTQRPTVQLLPGFFYTFEFVRNLPEEEIGKLAESAKDKTCGNPLLSNYFCADPTAVEYNGRLYVYATNDQQEYDYSKGLLANTYGKINSLVCFSSADMVNWTNHGVIDVKSICPWIYASWAPSVVSRVESDGKTHFYLYFTNSAAGIGVLTSTSPTGPWTDPIGKALIDASTLKDQGINISNIIDPGVAINSDGTEAYLTFGGGDVTGTELFPDNACIVKLGSDMVSLDGRIRKIPAPCHFEANELNYIGNKWVYSYCTRWSISSDWSKVFSVPAPSACSIVNMVADDPMSGEWTYRSVILPNPGTLGYPYGNNHSHIQKFGKNYYLLYHTQWLERQMGLSGGYRNVQMSRLTLVESTARMGTLSATSASLTGVAQLTAARVNPYVEQPYNLSAITTKDWWMVRGVDFGAEGNPAKTLVLKVKGTGTVEARLNDLDAESIAKVEFSSEEEQEIAVPLNSEINLFQQYLYFVFTANTDAEVVSWRFSSLPPEEAVGVETIHTDAVASGKAQYYSPAGIRLDRPQPGLNIVRYGNGTTVKVMVSK